MKHSFGDFLTDLVKEVKTDIDLLSSNACKNKWEVLKHLKDRVSVLENAVDVINREYDLQVQAVPKGKIEAPVQGTPSIPEILPENPKNPEQLQVFTRDELSKYTGKGGKPGLIAINGLVYDVSGNPAFAAGTHFGLSCGKDLTQEYMHNHAGSDMLDKLKLVGRLV